MRRQLLTRPLLSVGVALATVAGLGTAAVWAEVDIRFSTKAKVEKSISKLVGGEIDRNDSRGKEETLNEIDGYLQKDTKGVALRTPAFWVEAMQGGFFGKRKGWTAGSVREEKLDVIYADGSPDKAPFAYAGAKLGKDPKVLLVTLLPKGTDPKEWLEANWGANDTAKANWNVAAIAMSDKFPIAEQPHLLAYLFDTVRFNLNCDGNRWFLEGVGDACSAAQRTATTAIPDRLAGLILRDPTEAAFSDNVKLLQTVVAHSGDANPVAAKLAEVSAETTATLPAGDELLTKLAEWVEAAPARAVPSSYSFTTETTEDRILAPMAGAVYLRSPGKRGEPISFTINFDKAAKTVTLDGENLGEFDLLVNDDLLDLDEPVQIVCNGEVLETGYKFERSLKTIFYWASEFGEFGRVYTSSYLGHAPSKAAEAAADKKDGE